MENIIHRLDFYLDEPLGSKESIDQLLTFTQTNKVAAGIPDDVDLLWFKTQPKNLYEHWEYTQKKVLEAVTNPNQIIMFWHADHFPHLHDYLLDRLNEFSASVPNPVLFVVGTLFTTFPTPKNLKFTLAPIMYFEFESKLAWPSFSPFSDKMKTKKFLSMGTKDYPTRKFILSNIIRNGLLEQGYVSYKRLNSGALIPRLYPDGQLADIEAEANLIDHFLPLPELDNSMEYVDMPREFLYNSYLNMVTDTYYDNNDGCTFLSEKVFNAIGHHQMFIMLSPPHTLAFLKDNGYQTFSDYIDESYDSIENNYYRLKAVTDSLIDFINQPIERIHKIYLECKPILESNMQRFVNHKFSEKLISEIQRAEYEKTQIK